jgi:hypothetical protein
MGEYGLGARIVRAWPYLTLIVVIFLYEDRNLHQTLNTPIHYSRASAILAFIVSPHLLPFLCDIVAPRFCQVIVH